MGTFLLFWYVYIIKDTVTNTPQWCLSPALWAHLLGTPGSVTERYFLCSKSGSGVFFRQESLSFPSLLLWLISTHCVTNRTISFIWDWFVFLTSIGTKPPYHYCPKDQHFNGTVQPAAPKVLQDFHWLAVDYFGGKLWKLASPWQS